MNKSSRNPRVRDTVLLSGWLFADLLLALFVIFMAANTVGVKPQPIPTVPPSAIASPSPIFTPSPTPLPHLELHAHRFQITIDSQGLLSKSPTAIESVKQQIRSQPILRGQSVGLAIVYGGALNDTQIGDALQIAREVYDVMASLGKQNFAFIRASYYDPLYAFGNSQNIVVIDVFFFSQ